MAFLNNTIFKESRSYKKLAAEGKVVTFFLCFAKKTISVTPVVAVAPVSLWAQPLLSKPILERHEFQF